MDIYSSEGKKKIIENYSKNASLKINTKNRSRRNLSVTPVNFFITYSFFQGRFCGSQHVLPYRL